jgi:hypothetical protein
MRPNGHLYRVQYTRCRIDTINSPDDEHMAARNMYRIEINIHEKKCASSWLFTHINPYPANVENRVSS